MSHVIHSLLFLLFLCPAWSMAKEPSVNQLEECTQQIAQLRQQFEAKSTELVTVKKELDVTQRSLYQTILPRHAIDIKNMYAIDDQLREALITIQQLREALANKQPPATSSEP